MTGRSGYSRTCYPKESYPKDQVEICVECSGHVFVNGIPVSVDDIETVIERLKTVQPKPSFKVVTRTDAELGTYLKIRSLLETHNITPKYRILSASSRSLCR